MLIGLVLAVNLVSIVLRVPPALADEVVTAVATRTSSFERRHRDVTAAKPRSIDIDLEIPRHQIFGIIGPAQLRQDDAAQVHQPDDRFRPERPRSRAGASSTARTCFAMQNVYALRRRDRHGLSAAGRACRCRSTTTWPMRPRMARHARPRRAGELVEECLRQAALWDEVKDRLRLLGTQAVRRAAAAAHDRARAVAPAGDPLSRTVLDRRRSGDDDEDRGRAARAQAAR